MNNKPFVYRSLRYLIAYEEYNFGTLYTNYPHFIGLGDTIDKAIPIEKCIFDMIKNTKDYHVRKYIMESCIPNYVYPTLSNMFDILNAKNYFENIPNDILNHINAIQNYHKIHMYANLYNEDIEIIKYYEKIDGYWDYVIKPINSNTSYTYQMGHTFLLVHESLIHFLNSRKIF